VIDEPKDLGAVAARNAGARRTTGDILVFVDADVEIHADALERIRRAFDLDPELTAVFGSYDDDPADPGIVSTFRNLLHHYVHHSAAGPATTFWAGLGAIRRAAFLEIGGFDADRYPHPSIEDIELGMRLHRAGARLVLDPEIRGKHLKRWTLAEMARTDLLRRGVPWLRLLLAERSHSTALNLGWRERTSAAASIVTVVAAARRRPRLLAGAVTVLFVLDRRFYGLLLRRRGPTFTAAGVSLHLVHRLTAIAAVPIALAAHLRAKLRDEN